MAGDMQVGAVLAGYRIEGLAGRGGMGVVYVAEHVHLGRRVALKVLAPELAADESFRERFIRESRLAAQIEHPNAIPVYDAGEADGVLYIAMRLVDGTDLLAEIERVGPIEPGRAMAITGAVAGALDAAHADGLVHRDVKAANILLEHDRRGGEHVFLTDFGLTKRVGAGSGFTKTGTVVGTIDYMAPEQIQGLPLDGRVDQYALGCVLYQCLTGSVPFPRDSEVSAMYAHLAEPPPAVTVLRPDFPPAIDGVLARSMAKDPADRFETCAELVDSARAALEGRTVPAAPTRARAAAPPPPTMPVQVPGAPGTPRRPRVRTRTLVAIGVVVALVAGGTTAALLAGGSGPERSGGATGGPSTASPRPSNATPSGSGTTPAVPGVANGRIAFSENGNIVTVRPDGSGRTSLTSSASRGLSAEDTGAIWSPDGTLVAITRPTTVGVGPPPTIVVVRVSPDGSAATSFDLGTGVPQAWSPDSGSLAFSSSKLLGLPTTMLVAPVRRGGRADAVSLGRATEDSDATWTPDGRLVVFVVPSKEGGRVFGTAPSGGLVFQQEGGPGPDCCPSLSPDGSRLAVVSAAPGKPPELYVGKFDGRRPPTEVSDGPVTRLQPRWSPDGKRLLFVSRRSGNLDVYVVEADGSGLTDLTPDPNDDDLPVWSPDGTRIAFLSNRDGHFQTYVMDADGSDATNVSNSQFDTLAPSWQRLPG